MQALLAFKAWTRSIGHIETRASIIAVANSSVGRRCLLWNTCADALIPYPTRVVMPDDATIKRMMNAQRTAIQSGTPWCPLRALSAMGVMHGAKGSPRCPKVSTWAHGAWAHIRGATWGPAHARVEQGEHWRRAIEHASHITIHGNTGDFPSNDAINRAAQVLLRTADARFVDSQADPAAGTGHSLYMITWHRAHAKYKAWTRTRSNARRWSTGDGNEWVALSEAQNITDAARLLRLLCNALPGRARWRPHCQRIDHKCHQCTAQPVQLVWRSPSPPDAGDSDDGIAWCSACIQPGMAEHSWASLPEHMIPSTLKEQALSLRQGSDDASFDTRQSHYGACPLCGLGEAGAEHIWQWCTAAIMAWSKCGDRTSWREALSGRCNDKLRQSFPCVLRSSAAHPSQPTTALKE